MFEKYGIVTQDSHYVHNNLQCDWRHVNCQEYEVWMTNTCISKLSRYVQVLYNETLYLLFFIGVPTIHGTTLQSVWQEPFWCTDRQLYLQIGILGYTDDVTITSLKLDTQPIGQSTRLNNISRGSCEDADMHLNRVKTKMMQKQQVWKPIIPEIKDSETDYIYECTFCGRRRKTKRGLHIHKTSCDRQHGV